MASNSAFFYVLRVVWEPNSVFCYIRGCLGAKFCIMAQLRTVLRTILWLFYGWFVGCFMAQLGIVLGPFCDWFVSCYMAQLGTVLGPFLWLFYGWFMGCFMAYLWFGLVVVVRTKDVKNDKWVVKGKFG